MIRLVVDSSADLLAEELKEKNIELVPLNIALAGETYQDGVTLERNQFYEILTGQEDFPKTSQPSPENFLNIFEDAKEKGDDVICILLSSGLSGTCQAAHLAKNMAENDNVYIVDSLSATIGVKLLADYANDLRNQGASVEEIVAKLEEVKSHIRIYAGLDTLEFLCRGGRVSRTSAAIGDLANIKPIITVTEEGKVTVAGKCLGKNKALRFISDKLAENPADPNFPLYTIYSYGEENTEKLEAKFTKAGIEFADRLQVGATIGAHVGPGAFGIIYIAQ